MLVKVQFNSELALLEFLRGSTVVEARTGENGAGATTFTDNTGAPFADVQVDDQLFISGEPATFVVQSKTDDNNIVVSPVLANAHTDASYRILRGGRDISNFVFGPVADPTQSGKSWGIYDALDFG